MPIAVCRHIHIISLSWDIPYICACTVKPTNVLSCLATGQNAVLPLQAYIHAGPP